MENEKVLQALGLCARARGLIFGTPMVCEALRAKQKPRLVVEASENSPNTSKRIFDKCAFYGVDLLRIEADGEALARAVGKSGRVAVVAITDPNLCRLVTGAKTEKNS
jgi:ribosomal protein L7Ae-like RNA K-turn-binding protein